MAGGKIAVLGSENPDPGAHPAVGPCCSASLKRDLGLLSRFEMCTVHLLCSSLENGHVIAEPRIECHGGARKFNGEI